jgi:hypothetical protein
MAEVSVEVPAELLDAVRESAALLYGATAESLHLALQARGERRLVLGEVRPHRTRLDALAALLDQLGWSPGAAGSAVRLAGPAELLHDVLYGALIDAGERLAETSNRCWRGELPLDRVQERAEEVLAIDALLRGLDS